MPVDPIANGTARVRMPIALHELSIANAEKNGVSLNQWLVSLIAGGQNFAQQIHVVSVAGAPVESRAFTDARAADRFARRVRRHYSDARVLVRAMEVDS